MEQTAFEAALETIGQMVFSEEPEGDRICTKLIDLIREAFVPVRWPESQNLMEFDWFREECILDIDSLIGDSTYLVPIQRIIEISNL